MLRVSHLSGFNARRGAGGGGATITATLTDSDFQTANTDTYTFTGKDFGAADPDRELFALVTGKATAVRSFSSVTIAGNSASQVRAADNYAASNGIAAIYRLGLPTMTSGDVVVTFDDTMTSCGLAIVRLVGWTGSTTPHDTAEDNDGGLTLNIPSGGFALAVTYGNASESTWTGLTEKYDTQVEGAHYMTGAFDTGMSLESNRAISADAGAAIVAASFAV